MAPGIAVKIDNRYEILGELGRGGMGVVYRANDPKMDRLVAIKVMNSPAPGQEDHQERFLREARSIAKMQHPNIVVVYDYGYHGNAPYMAMEYVEGIPLDKVIASRVSLAPLIKVDFMVQVCQALHYAHQHNIVHRDVKPGNIMVLEGGKRVKLLDFGIARAAGSSSLSKSGSAMGTTYYMSPEQTRGQKNLDGRADIFSAGVVLYELLAGKPPWTSESDYEIMTKIINDPYPPLSGVLRNCPPLLDQVLERALAKDPAARYQTAEQMAQDLTELETPLKEQALEEALVQFEHGDLLRANDLVSQILRIDTRHREAIELRNKLQQVAQLQERGEQVRQLRTVAEEAVGQKRYPDALAAIEQAISIDSANTELFHYRELIRHEVKRREDVRKKLELAKRAQEINDLPTAEELVDKALQADPTDTQARMMKSSLEQEKKRQQQQEIAEDASRALAARAFTRARDLIHRLEAIDPSYGPLGSLRKSLLEGEAEEQRRIEIENAIRDIRPVLEAGDVATSLSLSEQALARFPGEPRLVRLRAQAEALRDAAERERAIQNQLAAIQKLAEKGQNGEALAAAENALRQLGTDRRLHSVAVHLRQAVEGERQRKAEQAVLSKAGEAVRASDYESTLKILTAARIEFPASKAIADALRTAQEAAARRADAVAAESARKREIAQALEHALASEPNPEARVRLAEEASRKIPGNESVEQMLARVRERRLQIASAVDRAQKFEQVRNYSESLREWERVRELYPQYPQLAARIARCTAALKPAPKAPEPVVAPPPPLQRTSEPVAAPLPPPAPRAPEPPASQSSSLGFSATSMTAAVKEGAPPPIAAPARPLPQPPVSREIAATESKPEATTEIAAPRSKQEVRPKKLWLIPAGIAAAAIVVLAVYYALPPKPRPTPNVAKPQPEASSHAPVAPGPVTLSPTEEPNPPALDAYLDITAPAGARVQIDGRRAGEVPRKGSYSVKTTPGNHNVEVTRQGLSWSGNVTARAGEKVPVIADLKPIPKSQPAVDAKGSTSVNPTETTTNSSSATVGATVEKPVTSPVTSAAKPAITRFVASPDKIQPGQSTMLVWFTQNSSDVSISDIGPVAPSDSREVKPTKTTKYTLTAKGAGGTETRQEITVTVEAAPPPPPVPQPTVAPVRPAEDPEIKAVRDTIQVRYKKAVESRLLSEVRKVWRSMGKEDEKDFTGSFQDKSIRAIGMDFQCEPVPRVNGDSAEYHCVQTMTFTLDNQLGEPNRSPLIFYLKKIGGTWYIERTRVGK